MAEKNGRVPRSPVFIRETIDQLLFDKTNKTVHITDVAADLNRRYAKIGGDEIDRRFLREVMGEYVKSGLIEALGSGDYYVPANFQGVGR